MLAGSTRWLQVEGLFIDLDGTLVDVSCRYYKLYRDLCQAVHLDPLPFKIYWDSRRQNMPLEHLMPEAEPATRRIYKEQWLSLIESSHYLEYDQCVPGAVETLSAIAGRYKLFLVTMRHDRLLMERQLTRLALRDFFEQTICRSGQSDTRAKWELIRCHAEHKVSKAVIVGDSEEDILAGKKLGFPTIGVASGIRTQEVLQDLQPDLIIQHIGELVSILNCRS